MRRHCCCGPLPAAAARLDPADERAFWVRVMFNASHGSTAILPAMASNKKARALVELGQRPQCCSTMLLTGVHTIIDNLQLMQRPHCDTAQQASHASGSIACCTGGHKIIATAGPTFDGGDRVLLRGGVRPRAGGARQEPGGDLRRGLSGRLTPRGDGGLQPLPDRFSGGCNGSEYLRFQRQAVMRQVSAKGCTAGAERCWQ